VRKVLVGGDMIGRKNAAAISRSFLDWLDRDHPRPFFAFLNYYDAHVPYLPPEPYRSRFLRPGDRLEANLIREPGDDRQWSEAEIRGLMSGYDGALAYLDAELDRLFAGLERRDLLRNTLIVITSDHGEEFNEHGLILHGNSLYRASLQVPLLLLWPGHLPAGKVVAAPVTTRDLPATILDLAGLRPARALPGTSLTRLWTDSTSRERDQPLIASVRRAWQVPSWYPVAIGDMMSVVWRGHRLIRGGDGKEALYDFDRDPEEHHDMLKKPGAAELAGPLRARLDSAAGRALRSP